MNSTTCDVNCTTMGGHMPYLYEVDSIFTELFKNKTSIATFQPIFHEMRRFAIVQSSQKFTFHISASYNFETEIWKSGGFKIKENFWAETNEYEQKFPILNDRLLLYRNEWYQVDHFGAIYCGDDLGEKDFKVRRNRRLQACW